MRIRKISVTHKWIRWVVWVILLTTLVGSILLGSMVPVRWQLPIVLMIIAAAFTLLGTRVLDMLREHRARIGRIDKNVVALRSDSIKLVETMSLLEVRAQKDEARLRQIGQLVVAAGEGVARLEARAHTDEMRIRHVGQLAKQAADAGETVTKIYDGMKHGIEPSETAGARPAASPVNALSNKKSIGRLAAAVVDDGGRARKLHQALEYSNSGERTGKLPVGVIGTLGLRHYLAEKGTVSAAILPGYSNAQLVARPLSVLIIEEAAFYNGPWFGSDSPQGTSLFAEIQELCAEINKLNLPIYVIRAVGTTNIYSRTIRDFGYVFPSQEFEEEWAVDAELGLMQDLQDYAIRESDKL